MEDNCIELIFFDKTTKILWKSTNTVFNKSILNLEKVVKKSSNIKKKYIQFLKKISDIKIGNETLRKKTKFLQKHFLYDYTFLNESSVFQTPQIFSFIKILYIKNILKNKKIKEIKINIDDGYACDVLKKISKQKKIKFTNYNKKKLYTYNRYFVPWILRSILLICIFLFSNFFFFKRSKDIKNKNIIISYMNQPSLSEKKVKSFFWGEFEKIFKKIAKKKVTWIFQDLINKNNRTEFKNLLKKNNNFIFFKNYLSLSDIAQSIFYFLKFNIKFSILFFFYNKKILKSFDDTEIYFYNDLKKSLLGFNCFSNILKIIMIKNIIKIIKPNSNIFYLFENQSWEKIMNNELYGKKINSYAILHSLLSKWDTRFHKINLKKNYLPKKILVNGDYNKKILKNFYNNLGKIEALRYIKYLKNNNSTKLLNKKRKVIDVYGSYDDTITKNLLKEISNSKLIKTSFKINFFPHPSSNLKNNTTDLLLNHNPKKNGFISLLPANSSIFIDRLLENQKTIIFNHQNFYDYQKKMVNGLIFNNYKDLENLFDKKNMKNQRLNKNFMYLDKKYTHLKSFLLNINV
jgi:surface carbohydrate biosynthesis protein (TIGR04326 family)